MNYLPSKQGFLGIENKFNIKEKAVVVPFGLEKTVSYGGGTKNGPKEIIKASHQVELFDEDLNCEPYKKIGIKTLRPFTIKKKMNEALEQISKINEILLKKNIFPMVLGGEHSITPGCIKPFVKKYKKICLLHFDAHADLRQSYNGNRFSHASAIRRCLDYKNVLPLLLYLSFLLLIIFLKFLMLEYILDYHLLNSSWLQVLQGHQ